MSEKHKPYDKGRLAGIIARRKEQQADKKRQKQLREASIPKRGMQRKIWYNDVYLRSEHWHEMVFLYKRSSCEMCGYDKDLALHHKTYKNIGQEKPADFATLCDLCHKASHIALKSSTKLKSPSKGLGRLAGRIQHDAKQKPESFAQYLRRRYIAKHGDANIPDINVFRTFFRQHIKGRSFPFNGAIHSQLDWFVKHVETAGSKQVNYRKQSPKKKSKPKDIIGKLL
jgi:hypothetical protein